MRSVPDRRRGLRRGVSGIALLAIAAIVIGCDQTSKHFAVVHLLDEPSKTFLGGLLRLEYAENVGAFLSLGAALPAWARTALFSVATSILLLTLVVVAARQRWPRSSRLALAFIVAGGASNLVDRVLRGRVIDFLNVGIGPIRSGIFNLADVAIVLGIAWLLAISDPTGSGSRRASAGTNAPAR